MEVKRENDERNQQETKTRSRPREREAPPSIALRGKGKAIAPPYFSIDQQEVTAEGELDNQALCYYCQRGPSTMEYFSRLARAVGGAPASRPPAEGGAGGSADGVASSSRSVLGTAIAGKRKVRKEDSMSTFMRNWEMIKVSSRPCRSTAGAGAYFLCLSARPRDA
jgi:hypothetical protein